MEQFEGILKLVGNELEAMNKNGKFRSREEIDSVYKLIDIAKDIYEVWCMEDDMESGEGGMSSRGYRNGNGYGNYNRGNYYDGGYERRGRGRNASRDSMGRYNEGASYRDGGMMRRGNYPYRDGGKEEFADQLRDMMQSAPDDQTRQSIQRMLQQIEQG